jgi:integrase/recombinase XerC
LEILFFGCFMNAVLLAESGQNSLVATAAINADLAERFTRFIDAKPKTIETYGRAIHQFLKYLAERGITQPQREDIFAYRDHLEATGHKPTTRQNYIIAVRLFFQWLEQERIYPNIAQHIKGAKLNRDNKRDYLSSSQIKSVLAAIDRSTVQGRRDYAMIALMATCGLRTIEVSRADIGDLRLLGDATVLYIQGKGRDEKAEYVKVSAPVEAAIRATFADRQDKSAAAPLFTSTSNNNAGQRLTTRSVSGIVKKHFKEVGIDSERQTAHSLRHSAVTLALLAGKSIDETQQFARHKNIATTMIYNHAIDVAKNTCAEAVSNSIF